MAKPHLPSAHRRSSGPSTTYNNPNPPPAHFGTSRTDANGNRIPGEVNGFGLPLKPGPPGLTPANKWADMFKQPTTDGPNAFQTPTTPSKGAATTATGDNSAAAGINQLVTGNTPPPPPKQGDTRKNSFGGTESFQPSSTGGRWVQTTSTAPVAGKSTPGANSPATQDALDKAAGVAPKSVRNAFITGQTVPLGTFGTGSSRAPYPGEPPPTDQETKRDTTPTGIMHPVVDQSKYDTGSDIPGLSSKPVMTPPTGAAGPNGATAPTPSQPAPTASTPLVRPGSLADTVISTGKAITDAPTNIPNFLERKGADALMAAGVDPLISKATASGARAVTSSALGGIRDVVNAIPVVGPVLAPKTFPVGDTHHIAPNTQASLTNPPDFPPSGQPGGRPGGTGGVTSPLPAGGSTSFPVRDANGNMTPAPQTPISDTPAPANPVTGTANPYTFASTNPRTGNDDQDPLKKARTAFGDPMQPLKNAVQSQPDRPDLVQTDAWA